MYVFMKIYTVCLIWFYLFDIDHKNRGYRLLYCTWVICKPIFICSLSAVLWFRLLQFHQTSVELEVSFWLVFDWCLKIRPFVAILPIICLCKLSLSECSPSRCSDIVSSAKFVLIVEKDATFQRLLDDNVCTKLSPCIIITVWFWSLITSQKGTVSVLCICKRCVCVDQGKGVPDVNSRLMVRKLWDTLRIPIFALMDADPHGTHHLSVSLLSAN